MQLLRRADDDRIIVALDETVKALGAEGAGSAALTFKITGTRAGGKPFHPDA